MKIQFDTLTLGGGPNWFLNTDFGAHDASANEVLLNLPRSDFNLFVTSYIKPKIRTYSGKLIGNNQSDVRAKKIDLVNRIKKTYTFTIVDDYVNDGATTTYASYQFIGTIIDVKVNDNWRSNYVEWEISIICPDPLLYNVTAITDTCNIAQRGFIFPMPFALVFSGSDNTMTVNNTGETDIYPIITLNGAGFGFTIINETSDLTDKFFTYSGTLTNAESLVIDPSPSTAIKATKNGTNVVGLTNYNWEALKLKKGTNVLTFFADGGLDAFSEAAISFKPARYGI